MSRVRKIAKNTTMLFVSQIITYMMGFFITMYSARYLGAEGFGIISLALAITGILVVFTDLGLGTLTVREVARDKSLVDKYTSNVAVIKLMLAIFTVFLTIVIVYLFGYTDEIKWVVYIITVSTLVNALSGIFYPIFQSYEKMEFQSVANVLNSSIMLIGTFIVIFYKLDIYYFAALYLASNVVVLTFIISVYVREFNFPSFDIDLGFWKPTLMMALPLSLVSIFSLIAYRVDTILLSLIKGSIVVGWYSASYRLMEVFLFLPGVFATAVFPVFSSLHLSSHETLKLSYQKSFKYLALLSVPVAVGTTVLAPEIVLLIYKSAFTPSIIILQILIWAIPITFLNYIFGTILPAMNRQNVLLKVTFLSMIFNIALNLVLIPTYSYVGAAVVTVATELFIFVLCLFILSKTFSTVRLQEVFFKPAVASLIMLLFLLYIKTNLFLEIAMGAIIYFVVLIVIRTFNDDDWDILRQIMGRKEN
jgi:O-antigen/teichoic acid export membrane protein